MLYLLDANVLITASNQYYPIDQVPEFWDWIEYQGGAGRVKIPLEIYDEIIAGERESDPLLTWIKRANVATALRLDEDLDSELVQRVVAEGYAPDLTDAELEQVGRDPFLIAYALSTPDRCVVTTEASKPSKTRQNRHVPDVCRHFGVCCCNTFQLNRELGFRTAWKP